MRLFGVSIGAYRLAMPRSVPPLLTPLLRGHLAAAADRFLNERGQMVEDVIGTRDPKSVAKFLVAEGYLEDPPKLSRKRRPKVDLTNRPPNDARGSHLEPFTELGPHKVAVYAPPQRGMPYLVVTIANGYVTSVLAAHSKEEAWQIAIDANR
jgi:hypothetical protein